jgi:hypothetical protein
MDANVAVTLLLGLLNSGGVWQLLSKANAEGRSVSKEELDALFANDDAAKLELDKAIAEARAANIGKPSSTEPA